jgi:hypothetical protein
VVEAWRLRVLIGALVTVNELGVRWGAKGHSIMCGVGDVLRRRGVVLLSRAHSSRRLWVANP